MPEIARIHHVSMTVTDIERSVPWYTDVLGLTKLMDEPHPNDAGYAVILGKPDFSFCVGLHTHPTNAGEPCSEVRTGLDHASFGVADRAELDLWEQRLSELGVEHSPVNDRGGYAVLVFRDPDNIQLEFICMG